MPHDKHGSKTTNPNQSPLQAQPKKPPKLAKATAATPLKIDQTPPPKTGGFFSRFTTPSPATNAPKILGVDREVSTIPRASPIDGEGKPANSEKESGVSEGGNWVYPSEKMFFEAMKRKGHSSEAKDMKTIVPIHNAVNERAWKEIKEWERPWGSEEKYVYITLDAKNAKLTIL